jgi:hypothetical protein
MSFPPHTSRGLRSFNTGPARRGLDVANINVNTNAINAINGHGWYQKDEM